MKFDINDFNILIESAETPVDKLNMTRILLDLERTAILNNKSLLENELKKLEFDRASGKLCYISQALDQFSTLTQSAILLLRNLSQSLTFKLKLSPEDQQVVEEEVRKVMSALSQAEVDLDIESSIVSDHKANLVSRSVREQIKIGE